MPSPKEVLERVLSTTLKLDTDAVAALYTDADRETLADDAADKVLELYTNHFESLGKVPKKALEEQFQFGERKAHKEWRDTVKALGLKSDKKEPKDILADLLGAKPPVDLSEDAVKKTPAYLGLEQEYAGFKTSVDKTIEEKVAAVQAEHQRERLLNQVVEQGEAHVLALKPVLPKDPIRAKRQLTLVTDQLRKLNYQALEGSGDSPFLLLDNEGKRLNDKFGHPVKFQDKVKEIAGEYFEFETGSERSTHGDPDKGTHKTVTLELPKDPNERADMLFKMQTDTSIPKDRVTEILKAAGSM